MPRYFDQSIREFRDTVDLSWLVIPILCGVAAFPVGCISWELSQEKSRLAAYNECLRNMHGRDVADVQMFCDKIKEKL
jgi:hypothetical protein